jgi:hypothetical protein
MHRFKALIVFVGATLGGITPALAGELTTTLAEPTFAPVAVSVGTSVTRASYKFQLQNTSASSTMSTVRLLGTTSVTGGDVGAKATFEKSTEYVCTYNGDRTSIDCAIGPLLPGAPSKEFTVTFLVPTSGTNIAFAWQSVFDKGVSPGLSNGDSDTENIGLFYSTSLASTDVPAGSALKFFTGSGVATKDDPWVTIVKIPSTSQATTATVEENVLASTCAGDLIDCRTSTLTIPVGTFGAEGARPLRDPTGNSPFLEITLLRDASTISKGARIASAIVYYRHDLTDPDLFPLPKDIVPPCDSTSFGVLPRAGQLCEDLAQRLEYPKRNTSRTPVAAGFESDWRFVFYAFDNGKLAQ